MSEGMESDVAYQIGKWYRVPCVYGLMWSTGRWWPVIGPKHEDAEFIGFPELHYHIDWRFVPKRFFPQTAWLNPLVYPMSETQPGERNYPRNADLSKPELRRAKYCREMPAFPQVRVTWMPKLKAAYAGCKLKAGMVCPHRGIPLNTLPVVAGVVTCPGHGLRWNVETGELMAQEPDR